MKKRMSNALYEELTVLLSVSFNNILSYDYNALTQPCFRYFVSFKFRIRQLFTVLRLSSMFTVQYQEALKCHSKNGRKCSVVVKCNKNELKNQEIGNRF